MIKVLVFDINETLLNLAVIDSHFERAFGSVSARLQWFEQVLSVDAVERFKPAVEAYRMAARELGVPVAGVRLIAAHNWDVAGALRAGCAAAFVERPGMVLSPLSEQPDIVGQDMREVVDQILGG